MFSHLLVASSLFVSLSGAQPPDYSDKGLCDLWAGARCHATACLPDARQRCHTDSAVCRGRGSGAVESARAERVAQCARALLKAQCGEPAPAECAGIDGP